MCIHKVTNLQTPKEVIPTNTHCPSNAAIVTFIYDVVTTSLKRYNATGILQSLFNVLCMTFPVLHTMTLRQRC